MKNFIIFMRVSFWMIYITSYGFLMGILGLLTRKRADGCIHRWAKHMIKTLDIRLTVHNPERLDKVNNHQRVMYMINHASLYDIPIFYHTIPGTIRMIAKKELFKIPFFSRAMHAAEVPSIDRQNRAQAVKDLEYAQKIMESGVAIAMFPEGTRSKDGQLQPLKKGGIIMAINAKATIIPIGIRGSHDLLPKKTFNFTTGLPVSVHIGEAIDAGEYDLDDKDKLITKVHESLQTLLTG